MALEPTEEQGNLIAAKLMQLFATEATDAIMAVEELWPLIRDMVLEAAARVCDRMHHEGSYSDEAYVCAERIRALKGK